MRVSTLLAPTWIQTRYWNVQQEADTYIQNITLFDIMNALKILDIMIFLLSDFARVIVEVQMTMLLVPLLHGQFKMTTTLRSLTLIDATFSQVSNYGTNIMFPMRTTIKPASNLKRKIGYHDEEISSTREKLSRMDLDDTARREKGNQETIEHLD